MDRIDAGNRREPGGPGGRRSGAGGRGPGCCALDMAHGLSGFFVVSWSFPGICLVSFLYVFGVLDFFLYLTGLLYFSKVFWKGNFLVYIMFLVFFWCVFYKLWRSSIF